jgi:hypothetical protein
MFIVKGMNIFPRSVQESLLLLRTAPDPGLPREFQAHSRIDTPSEYLLNFVHAEFESQARHGIATRQELETALSVN